MSRKELPLEPEPMSTARNMPLMNDCGAADVPRARARAAGAGGGVIGTKGTRTVCEPEAALCYALYSRYDRGSQQVLPHVVTLTDVSEPAVCRTGGQGCLSSTSSACRCPGRPSTRSTRSSAWR